MTKQYFIYVAEKTKYATAFSRGARLYPRISCRYNQKRANILIGLCSSYAEAEERAINDGYILKDIAGGYVFTAAGINKLICV